MTEEDKIKILEKIEDVDSGIAKAILLTLFLKQHGGNIDNFQLLVKKNRPSILTEEFDKCLLILVKLGIIISEDADKVFP